MDYFLVIKESYEHVSEMELVSILKNIPVVLGVFPLNPQTLKSRRNLSF
jgi:hypothetical protein